MPVDQRFVDGGFPDFLRIEIITGCGILQERLNNGVFLVGRSSDNPSAAEGFHAPIGPKSFLWTDIQPTCFALISNSAKKGYWLIVELLIF
jgi:hypothetical protein